LALRDLLIDEKEIAEILNKGARDTNTFNALKYVQAIVEYKGLIGGIGDNMQISIPGLTELSKEEYEASIDYSQIRDDRIDIEEFLFGKENEDRTEPTSDNIQE
jgi:hypothetical protein